MKTLVIATVLLVLVAAVSGQRRKPTSQIKTVSAASISRLGAGKTYQVDLTRKGTVYRFDAEHADLNRVSIRTAGGAKTFGELLKMSNTTLKGSVLVGRLADMRSHLPVSRAGGEHFDCGVVCRCDGTADCIDMIVNGSCSDEIWCTENFCYCVAKP